MVERRAEMDYLFIDGNNLAIRAAFINDYMANSDGISSGAHYGFFNSLISLRHKFQHHQIVVVWDSGSKRRKEETKEAKDLGVIQRTYKEGRKTKPKSKPLQDWFETGHHLKNALAKTGIPQITMEGHEADDVIASYCELLKKDNNIVIVTSDHDYYQILDHGVMIWDGMKEEYITEHSFRSKNGIEPLQHIDVGALMGDKSDDIAGIPGWGEGTSIKAIKKSESWKNVIKDLENRFLKYEDKYPSVSDEEFEFLSNKKTPSDNSLYPEIYRDQPHLGILKGFDEKKIKGSKRDIMALIFKDRVKLAYSLKKMDIDIPNLPTITKLEKDKGKLLEYFQYYDIVSLVSRVDPLFE
jgi:DNA polymerase-1